MKKNPAISIVVPVYKVERYLDKCVQSICAQTFSDFELILVDDGSPDDCPAMCDAWAEKDVRIRVIHQTNGGLSAARNAGIEVAMGTYLSFVDSDDYIEPDMLERLLSAIEKNCAQMAVCNFRSEDDQGNRTENPPVFDVRDSVIGIKEYWKGYFSPATVYYVVAWNKLYKKELFDRVRYPVGKRNEDEFVLYSLLSGCERIVCLNYTGYHYVQREGSIMQTGNPQDYLEYWEVYLMRAGERCRDGEYLFAEGLLNDVILELWQRRDIWNCVPEFRKRYRCAVRNAAAVYAALARQTGNKSMWIRMLMLRMGMGAYISFLKKRSPERFTKCGHAAQMSFGKNTDDSARKWRH